MSTAELLPQYTELQELGQGAQGRVVLARHTGSSELVAIKLLAPELLGDERQMSRFRYEAELLAQVRNPHVAQVREYLQSGYQAAIVMEAVNGVSLQKVIKAHGRLTIEASLVVLKGSLLGLDAAHQMGIVHRDYKPANVVVQGDGQSKLIDFGVAALTGDRSMSGTPAYMAPEQWKQEEATPSTDVYAATCVFYECLTGRHPFHAQTIMEMAERHLHADVPVEDLPDELHGIVIAGMAKNPARRPPRALTFVKWLEQIASEAYGADWESRGLAALAAGATALAVLFPLSLLTFSSTTAQTSVATTALSNGSGKAGWLAKVGGGKAGAGVSSVVAGTICWLVLSGPDVGGTSTASYRQWFSNAGLILGNSTIPPGSSVGPSTAARFSVTPSRAEHGTQVTVHVLEEHRLTWGLEYLSEKNYRCHDPDGEKADAYHQTYSLRQGAPPDPDWERNPNTNIWLYPATLQGLPDKTTSLSISAKVSINDTTRAYQESECAWVFKGEYTFRFTMPKRIKSGKYRLSARNRQGIVSAHRTVNGAKVSIPLETAGLRTEGGLPLLTVLG